MASSMTETQPQIATGTSIWRNRTFLSMWGANLLSVIGDGFHSVALGLWVLRSTGSATAMATIMTVRVVIGILLGAVAGTVVDRVDRRRLMIVTDVLRFGLVGAVAYMLATPGTSFSLMLLFSGLIAVCSQFFSPAFQASLTNIVSSEDLPQASSLLQITNMLGQVVGPFLGGTIVAVYGGWAALAADSASFLVSAGLILIGGAFPSPRREATGKTSIWAEMREGLAYIRQNPLVSSVVTLAPIVNFFGNALGAVLFPVIAVKVWLATDWQFGATEAIFPLGFAIGAAILMATMKRMRRRGLWMSGGILAGGFFFTAVSVMPSATAALPLMLISGMLVALPNVLLQVALQSEVPTDVQGRVFGTLGSLTSITSPLAFVIAGSLSDAFNPVTIAVGAGILFSISALVGFFLSPGLRQYD